MPSTSFELDPEFPKPRSSTGTAAADRKKYGCMGVAELRKLRQLEEENAQLRKLVAELSLDKQMLRDVIKKSCEALLTKKEMAYWPISNYRVLIQRACCLKLVRAMHYYKSHRSNDTLLTMRIKEIATARFRSGFRRVYILLKR